VTMKVVALVALIAVVCASDNILQPTTVNVTTARNTTETRFVKHAHRATLNFACPIDSISVVPFEEAGHEAPFVDDAIVQTELEDHLGEVGAIQWAHVLQTHFQSTDPRGQDRELATIGGDLGEFLMVLGAMESTMSEEISAEDTHTKFKAYLTAMSKEKFFFNIDSDGIDAFKKYCGCPNLNIADPPDAKKDLLLNATSDAATMGDEFFRKVITDPAAFGLRAELVQNVVGAFFKTMWDKSDPLHRRIKFVLLKGKFEPKATIMVHTPGYCNSQLLAPMISPELCGKQMSIYHGDAAVLLRTEMAGILLLKTPEDKNAVVRQANEMSTTVFTKLMEDHREPLFNVQFQGLE